MDEIDPRLNPAQAQVARELLLFDRPFPVVEFGLREHLVDLLELGTGDAVAEWYASKGEELWVSKSPLTEVHHCEALWQESEFSWALPIVVGEVVHTAIQHQHIDRRRKPPSDYVESALETVREGRAFEWLDAASEAQLLELRSQSATHVGQWTDAWPPMHTRWQVQGEVSMTRNLLGGKLVLSAKPDLIIGPTPKPTLATKAIIDVKTSASLYDVSRYEAWFYALVMTLRVGVPPHRSIIYSIPSGDWQPEPEISQQKLEAAARRVIDGVRKMVDVGLGKREAARTPSPRTYCGWCPLQSSCPEYAAEAGPGRAIGGSH